MLVIVPMWSASPPESVRAFFLGTRYNETIWNFFGPPFMVARLAPLLGDLIVGWHLQQHRGWLLLAAVCMAFGAIFTLAYVYPINDMLFAQAGGNRRPEEIQAMARQWIMADRVRFGVGVIGFLARLPGYARKRPIQRLSHQIVNGDASTKIDECYGRSLTTHSTAAERACSSSAGLRS